MKLFKRFFHTIFPKMCTLSYRWVNDWLICDRCGTKLGYKYLVHDSYDNPELRVQIFKPYMKYINKEELVQNIKGDNTYETVN